MSAVETSSLTKRYGETVAVDSLDMTVEEGDVFGFLGPNGAGKTTTIDTLLGYATPTSGEATVLGGDPSDATTRQTVGVLPEDFGVYPRLTGAEHVEFAADSKGVDDDPYALLERVGLGDDADERADGYSKGMKKRLLLATALVGEPELLVLDEPTSGLDPNGALRVREIVEEENRRGATVFFSSHILGQVEAVCDKVGIMRDGTMAAVDTVEGLRDETGGVSRLTLVVDSPDDAAERVREVDNVTDATVEEGTVVVSCRVPEAKVDAFNAAQEVCTITDFTTEERSLDEIFAEVTNE